jgi:phage terminase large subunit
MTGHERIIDLPPWSHPLFDHYRYKSLRGGRGSGKSWTVATALLLQAGAEPLRTLCARELQNSIKDSVHRLLVDRIATLGLPHFTVTDREIRHANGSLFLFEGIRSNVTKIKSMEGLDRVWVEEAQAVSDNSWETLIPTVRKEGSEVWLTWNPDQDTDPTYKRFVKSPPDKSFLELVVNWDANEWLSSELAAEKDYLYRIDPEAAAHVWGGQTRRVTDAQVLRGRYVVESFEPGKDWHGPYFGADWGFSVDPTTLVRCWVHERRLYIEHEAYGVGVDLDDTPALFDKVPGSKERPIRADNSRPETISHMRRHGYGNVIACVKRQGSVEDGVEHIRSYEKVVIHPRCTHAAEEARLWSYKTDRLTGEVLPVLLDKHNHIFDAVRYGLELVIQRGKPVKAEPKPKPKAPDYTPPRRNNAEKWKWM